MSDTKKKYQNSSPKKTDYSTLIYLLVWILLSGLLIVGIYFGYNYWEKKQKFKEDKAHIFNVQDERPEKESKRKYEDARQNIYTSEQRIKKFTDKIAQNQKKLGQWQPVLTEIENNLITYEKLKKEKHDPQLLEENYLGTYRQLLSLGRLGHEIFSVQEIEQQVEAQEKWLEEKVEAEIAEAEEKIKDLMEHFYKPFYDQLNPEEKFPWNIEPVQIKKRPANPANRKAETDYLLAQHSDLRNQGFHPLTPIWKGFTGFIKKEEDSLAKEKEGSHTMGVTIGQSTFINNEGKRVFYGLSDHKNTDLLTKGDDIFKCITTNLTIEIKLKKEFLFTRQNRYYTEWISDFKDDEKGRKGWNTLNISEESLLNTIAHELAHAIINNIIFDYEPDTGGHGDLHDEYTDQLEDMIKKSSVWVEFLAWWREPWNGNHDED